MASRSWVLTDVEKQVFQENWKEQIADGVTASKRVLQGGKQQGVDSVRVESSSFSFEVLPTRGMNVWKIWADGFEYGWQSPAKGPVHPSFVPLMEPGGLGWLDGFDEVFVRCGLESNGAPDFDEKHRLTHPLHGKIANLPARKVQVAIDDNMVTVSGVVEESRFHFLKLRLTTKIEWEIGSSRLDFVDQVENLSANQAEMQMLYHLNFGTPLLDSGSQFHAAVKKVVPRNAHAATSIDGWQNYAAPTAGFEEQVYFLELASDDSGWTQSMLKNAHGTKAVSIFHQPKVLPCFSLWKNTTALEDGYVTGLEPATNFPNPRSFEGEQKRFVSIPAKQTHEMKVGMEFHTNEGQVNAAVKAIHQISSGLKTEVVQQPDPNWCHGVEANQATE